MKKSTSNYNAGDVICTFDKGNSFVEGKQLIISTTDAENEDKENNKNSFIITHYNCDTQA